MTSAPLATIPAMASLGKLPAGAGALALAKLAHSLYRRWTAQQNAPQPLPAPGLADALRAAEDRRDVHVSHAAEDRRGGKGHEADDVSADEVAALRAELAAELARVAGRPGAS